MIPLPRRHATMAVAFMQCALPLTAGVALPAQIEEDEIIVVIGTTPVRRDDLDARDFPGRIQGVSDEALARGGTPDISGYLNRYFGGVHVNSAQGNPLQVDLYYRGFAASPLLGLPMGMAIYQNGVRLNEPLGDTVNWDLVPLNAIAGMSLLSGSNPLYGLNTLGGAVVLEMKNGLTHPGHSVKTEGGSYNRFIANFESGGGDRLGYYVNAQRFYERGWRDLSNSWAENLYASLDWRPAGGSLSLNYHRGISNLMGNGLSPIGLLNSAREEIFTAPDITENDMYMWTFGGDYGIGDKLRVSGNLYYRDNDTGSLNGDAAEYDDGVAPQCGDDDCDAVNNISSRGQESLGGALEIDFPLGWLGLNHHLNAGVGYYEGRSQFESRVQFATLDPNTRSTRGRQSVTSDFSDEDDDNTNIATRIERVYGYVGDTISIGNVWTISLAGFFHDSTIRLRDRSGARNELNGDHAYHRLNWSIGAVRHWGSRLDIYGGYSESSRLPTPIELACSPEVLGENQECRLPNAFLADPPLDEVVSSNVEFGLRGTAPNDLGWTLGVFHTGNGDDIIWQTTGRAHGAFRNVDETRRRGIEASLAGGYNRLNWMLNYTYIEATFEDDFEVLVSEEYGSLGAEVRKNASGIEVADVARGGDMPGIPRHLFKAAADYAITDNLSVGLDMIAVSDSYSRGDESNQLAKVGGYAVFNVHANYRIGNVELSVLVENLFDKNYQNFGLIGETPILEDVLELDDERALYYAPGAPVSAWAGVKVNF